VQHCAPYSSIHVMILAQRAPAHSLVELVQMMAKHFRANDTEHTANASSSTSLPSSSSACWDQPWQCRCNHCTAGMQNACPARNKKVTSTTSNGLLGQGRTWDSRRRSQTHTHTALSQHRYQQSAKQRPVTDQLQQCHHQRFSNHGRQDTHCSRTTIVGNSALWDSTLGIGSTVRVRCTFSQQWQMPFPAATTILLQQPSTYMISNSKQRDKCNATADAHHKHHR